MAAISNPVNDVQRSFNELCEKGGGARGGPARTKVRALLCDAGKRLNKLGFDETAEHLRIHGSANPWHICFALGLGWGHLAKIEIEFTSAVVSFLEAPNDDDLKDAQKYHLERGPDPIRQSLIGGHQLFAKVKLPDSLPNSFDRLITAQERWLSPILSKERPPFIGSWNGTAMFMIALFAQPELAAAMTEPGPMLPPGGPIHAGLRILYRANVLTVPPAGSELDDQAFEPGAIYENNALFAELRKGLDDWSLVDVHSGVYMLGTRTPLSQNWT